MKIAIVCYPTVGGSGVVATNLGKALAELGHEIHFISYDQPFGLDIKKTNLFFHKVNINEYSLFKYPDYTLPLTETIVMVHQRYKLDVVHVHYAVPHATAALFAKRIMITSGIQAPKIITTLHGTDITLLAQDPNLYTVIKYSIERSDGVTSVSQSLKNDTLKTLRTEKPIEVIYDFYQPTKPSRTRAQIRKELKIRDKDFVAIHLSNLRPIKRVPDLLKIAGLMSRKGGLSAARSGSNPAGKKQKNFRLLILAGSNFDQYKPLAKKLGLGRILIVKENITDVRNYINAADAGIYTSETESFGMGILETMAYGKPVLATNAGGIPEVLDNGTQGYLLPVGDVRGFAKKLTLLMNNQTLTNKLGHAAMARAREKFSSAAVVQKYLDFYNRCCKK